MVAAGKHQPPLSWSNFSRTERPQCTLASLAPLKAQPFIFLCSISPFCHRDCREVGKSVLSTRQNRERKKPAQNVFSSMLPGEPGLDSDMCWRCGVQSKPLNYFFGTSKKTLHIKGDPIPAPCIAGIIKHFA